MPAGGRPGCFRAAWVMVGTVSCGVHSSLSCVKDGSTQGPDTQLGIEEETAHCTPFHTPLGTASSSPCL